MADTSKSKSSSSAPNFYSAMSDMGAYKPGAQSQPADGGAAGAGSAGGATGDKVQSVTTLLEVLRKMERSESDQAAKDLLQQMATLAEQYMQKISPASAKAAGAATGPDGAASPAGAAAPSGDTSTGAAGSGATA